MLASVTACDYHRIGKEALEAKVKEEQGKDKDKDKVAVANTDTPVLGVIELPDGSDDTLQNLEHESPVVEKKDNDLATTGKVALQKIEKTVVSKSPVADVSTPVEETASSADESLLNSVKGFISSGLARLTGEQKLASAYKESGSDPTPQDHVEPLGVLNKDSVEVCLKLTQSIPDEPYFYQFQALLRKSSNDPEQLEEAVSGYANFWNVPKKVKVPADFAWRECYPAVMVFERFAEVRAAKRRTVRENTQWVSDQWVKILARQAKPETNVPAETKLAH